MRRDDDEREEHEDQLGLLVDSRDGAELDVASQDSQRSTLFTVCPFILGTVAATTPGRELTSGIHVHEQAQFNYCGTTH